jgi:secondary thiamine-phosphate synthase enzyme
VKTLRLELDMSDRWYAGLNDEAAAFVSQLGNDHLNVFVPHATAGLAVIELGDGSEGDLHELLQRVLPRQAGLYRHHHGSPGHGADHLLPALLSPSLTVPVIGGRLALGTWQSIVFVELNVDNPRREVLLSFLAAA